jgi:hypothetical protein
MSCLKRCHTLRLQEVNPLPFVAMIANGMGWLAYGLHIHDFFVFGSNIAALVLGVFYVMTCSKFAEEKVGGRTCILAWDSSA